MKRPLSHRLFSAVMALLVLTASVGMAVQQHTCRKSGYRTTTVVFSTPRHRCPAPATGWETTGQSTKAQLTSSCCDFQAHLHKLDVPAPKAAWAKLLPPIIVSDWLLATVWPRLPSAPLIARTAVWHASDSSPPPRAGRQLLAFIHVLVV